jgi:hypothetical protein
LERCGGPTFSPTGTPRGKKQLLGFHFGAPKTVIFPIG